MARISADMTIDGGEVATPVDNTPRNSFASQLAALSPEQVEAATAVADARTNAASVAASIGGTVDENGKVVMPDNYQTGSASNTNQLKDKSNPPVAPEGYQYIWIGGTNTGSWKLYASSSGGSGGSGSGGGNTNITLISTGTDPSTGATLGYFSDGSSKVLTPGGVSTVQKDAYALLQDTFHNYGLDSLVPVIQSYMQQNLGSEQASLQLKQTKEYQTRFAGNQLRLSAGLNALTESEYLALENSYSATLNAYGLNNIFGTTRDQEIAGMAKVIGGAVNATEFADRVSTVVDRVMNADPNIKKTLTQFYNLTDADLVKYYLDPSKDNLANLKLKTTAAEIGTAATEQGLTTGVTSATALAQAGVTQAQAQKGYATIGEILPTAQKLSNIYGAQNVGYDQATAEAEVFNTTGSASAARARKQIADLETQAFQGRSGISNTVNPLGKGLQGSF